MKYQLLNDLIPLIEHFENESSNHKDLKLFAYWLNNKYEIETNNISENLIENERLEVTISRLIGFMGRYAKFYVKKALEGTDLLSMEEFTFLATLIQKNKITKSELINRNLMEKPTGMEVINRLISNGHIIQEESTTDKRSKLLSISETGKIVLFSVFGKMDKVADILVGKLSKSEMYHLAECLIKLDHFHNDIFFNYKNESLIDIHTEKKNM